MKFIDKLQRKYGRYGIENLMKYIIFGKAIVYILSLLESSIISVLYLSPTKVFQGEVWRLISFIFVPPSVNNPLFVFIALYFYYFIGSILEKEWGKFRFNFYYLIGTLSAIAVSLIFRVPMDNSYLNMSLFWALAMIYPDYQIRLFFLIPIKIKYLAIIDAIFIVVSLVSGSFQGLILVLLLFANFFMFFGPQIIRYISRLANRKKNNVSYKNNVGTQKAYYHKCHVCNRTELDDPDLEFRYCSKCDGEYEYCMDHLLNHEHIKKNKADKEN